MTDISNFFELNQKDDCVYFMGDKLECYSSERYANFGYLDISDKIYTVGIFAMKINDSIECGINLNAGILIEPSNIEHVTIDNEKYVLATLKRGNKLMCRLSFLQDDKLYYTMWREFLSVGHLPKCFNYNNIATIFDNSKFATGKGISIDHAVLEVIYAHLFRDPDDLNVFYRLTNMTKKPAMVTMKSVAYGPSGTFAKIAGSYAQEGYNSALLNQADKSNELEDLFRG